MGGMWQGSRGLSAPACSSSGSAISTVQTSNHPLNRRLPAGGGCCNQREHVQHARGGGARAGHVRGGPAPLRVDPYRWVALIPSFAVCAFFCTRIRVRGCRGSPIAAGWAPPGMQPGRGSSSWAAVAAAAGRVAELRASLQPCYVCHALPLDVAARCCCCSKWQQQSHA